jgi:hypothetical protein
VWFPPLSDFGAASAYFVVKNIRVHQVSTRRARAPSRQVRGLISLRPGVFALKPFRVVPVFRGFCLK